MAKTYTIAGQSAPAANTDTSLYVVPAGKMFVASTLVAANRHAADSVSIRVAIVPAGDTLSSKHYVEYERMIAARDNRKMTWGISLPAGATVYVRCNTSDASFSLFGVLIDIPV